MVLNNKRAQEGPGMGTLIGLAVVIIAAVLIILFLTGFFNKLTQGGNQLPSALAAKAEVCKNIASNQVAFCEFTEVKLSGVKGDSYVNCDYDDGNFQKALKGAGDGITCNDDGTEFCKRLIVDPNFKGANINDKDCIKDADNAPTFNNKPIQ